MKRFEKRSDMRGTRFSEDEPSSIVLNFLKLLNERERTAREEGVAVVETRENKGTEESFGGFDREDIANRRNSAYLKIA